MNYFMQRYDKLLSCQIENLNNDIDKIDYNGKEYRFTKIMLVIEYKIPKYCDDLIFDVDVSLHCQNEIIKSSFIIKP